MPATYEFWLSDDRGRRIELLKDFAFASYTRTVSGMGTLQLGLPFKPFADKFNPYFLPDWRIEVWRSAAQSVALRCEDVFMLLKPDVYTRTEDGLEMLVFYGHNGNDLLKRRSIIQKPGTSYADKTATLDDMMKAIVREQMLYGSALDVDGAVDNTRAFPDGEFTVQGDNSLGSSVSRSFAGRNVYDVLKDLKTASLTSTSEPKIYFDVVPIFFEPTSNPVFAMQGWEFRTYADLRGSDRTTGVEFSVENENLKSPQYSVSHIDEINSVIVTGNGRGDSQLTQTVTDSDRANLSRWNLREKVISASNESSATGLTNAGNTELGNGKPKDELSVVLVNNPGSRNSPQSLYGIDWDLGDRVRANVARKQFNMEIGIVYVAVSDDGRENISARNVVNE